ncbi:hypothetical protein BX070DRAFT_221611 [Coemansia spiralis]|nr:hypothetical protein BX070DRAFT_221611 [Coemansia spiralis]
MMCVACCLALFRHAGSIFGAVKFDTTTANSTGLEKQNPLTRFYPSSPTSQMLPAALIVSHR